MRRGIDSQQSAGLFHPHIPTSPGRLAAPEAPCSKHLPIWQNTSSVETDMFRTAWHVFPASSLGSTQYEYKETHTLLTFIPAALGSFASGARKSSGVQQTRCHLAG